MQKLAQSHLPPPKGRPLARSLKDYLHEHADSVLRISKPVSREDIGALSAQSDEPVLFENIVSSMSVSRLTGTTILLFSHGAHNHHQRVVDEPVVPIIESRQDPKDFVRASPRNWGKVHLKDYL